MSAETLKEQHLLRAHPTHSVLGRDIPRGLPGQDGEQEWLQDLSAGCGRGEGLCKVLQWVQEQEQPWQQK